MTKGNRRLFYFVIIMGILSVVYRYLPFNFEYIGFKHKIYAHRVNSIEKLESAVKYFDGIELDLVYDDAKNILDINHPPATSIGLSFETYLSEIQSSKKPKLWLDIKNLSTTNSKRIYLKLVDLLKESNYKLSDVLVETVHPDALAIFSKEFKITYYLPIKIDQRQQHEKDSIVRVINSKLQKLPNLGLSLQYDDYNFIKTHFPLATKNVYSIPNGFKFKQLEIRERLKDTTVAILITPYRALKGNR
ncbi:MAG: hypothetical protein WBF67_07010 [Olleya sp.]